MNYLALGDSMSIDRYTGLPGGGAVAQFAGMIAAVATEDLTYDGCTTAGVLDALNGAAITPDIITVTAGGNDLLVCAFAADLPACARRIEANLTEIARRLAAYRCDVILNTVYDPTDGDDALAQMLGLPITLRPVFEEVNAYIRRLARKHGYLLADLADLFHGHGLGAKDSWLVQQIEPNLLGATAIVRCWYGLWRNEIMHN